MKKLSPDTIRQIEYELSQGNKIQAIKIFKEATAVSLLAAKEAIDSWEQAKNPDKPNEEELWQDKFYVAEKKELTEAQIQAKIASFLADNQKLQAIKWLKEVKNLGLKEAKDYVDALENKAKDKSVTTFLPPRKEKNKQKQLPKQEEKLPTSLEKQTEKKGSTFTNLNYVEQKEPVVVQPAYQNEGKIDIKTAPVAFAENASKEGLSLRIRLIIALILTALACLAYEIMS